jgi:hypothetical protein
MSDNETNTPLTDAAVVFIINPDIDSGAEVVPVVHARSLERQLAEARNDADALRAELATAKADTERLDWMINQRFRVNPQIIDGDGPFWDVLKSRQAIDSTMKGGER